MREKKPLKTIGFRIYLHASGYATDTGVGNVVLLDKYGKESYGDTGNKPFSNLDEIPRAIRLLIRDTLGLKRKLHDNWWEFVPKKT